MSLLTNVMDHSLDDGYAEAAERKKAAGDAGLPKTLRAKLGSRRAWCSRPWS
ncbi:hypothetical protein SPURM210S_04560 [Streptomyces purpurascens]